MIVSCVIPALNEATHIRQAVERAWAAGANEVLVVDGGSTDGTVEQLQDVRCRVLISERGRARQQNAGAAAATGDVLLFLHADNWLAAGVVEQIRSALADPAVNHGAFRQRIEADGGAFRVLEWGNAWRVRRAGVAYGDQGLFVRRDAFGNAGGFADVPLLEDLLLSRMLRRKSWPVLLDGPINVSARRWRKNGLVRQTLRNWTILVAHWLGVSPQRLARMYR